MAAMIRIYWWCLGCDPSVCCGCAATSSQRELHKDLDAILQGDAARYVDIKVVERRD